MDSRDITLRTDERWCAALESSTGKTMETLLQEKLDELIQGLPQQVQNQINAEIRQEDLNGARQRLDGNGQSLVASVPELRGHAPLPVDTLTFSDSIEQIEQLLNFYVDTTFDVDAVFGTNVCTDENDDWLNVYANYDMERGCVCDTLDIYLVRSDVAEQDYEYRLSESEMRTLLSKMDNYCKEQLGITLDTARDQYLSDLPLTGDQVRGKTLLELLDAGVLDEDVSIIQAVGGGPVIAAEDLGRLTASGRSEYAALLSAQVKSLRPGRDGVELEVDGVEPAELERFAQDVSSFLEAEDRMTMC